MKNPPAYAIGSVDNVLHLALLLQREGSIGITEAAKRLGVSPSTAHRLLSMLVYRDFAEQEPNRRYRVGSVLAAGETVLTPALLLRRHSLPHMRRLCKYLNETITLQVRIGAHVHFIETVECNHYLRVGDRSGHRFPAHKVSGGKALLGSLSDAAITRLYTAEREVGIEAVLREAERTREAGYAINNEESEVGITAIGVVVPGEGNGEPLGALTVAIPTARYCQGADLAKYVSSLTLTASSIAEAIGASEGTDIPDDPQPRVESVADSAE